MNIRNILLACICIAFTESGQRKNRKHRLQAATSTGSCELAAGLLDHGEVESAKYVPLIPADAICGQDVGNELMEMVDTVDRGTCLRFLEKVGRDKASHGLVYLLEQLAKSPEGQSDPHFEVLRKAAEKPVFVHLPDGSRSIECMTYHDLINRIAEVIPKLEALGKELESLGEDLQAEAFMVILNENVDELRRAAAEAVDVVSYQHYLHDKNLSGFLKVVKGELKTYKKVKEKHVVRTCQAAGTTFRLCTKVLGALQKRMDERRKMHLLLGMTEEAQASRLCVYTSFVKDIADTSADG